MSGQSLAQSSDFGTIIFTSLALVALCVVGFYAIATLRKKMKEDDTPAVPGTGGFTLSDLRELHASGQMTDEEFEKAKHLIVSSMKAQQAATVAAKVQQQQRDRIRGAPPPTPLTPSAPTKPNPTPPASKRPPTDPPHHHRPPT